jgi:hypothetical protein
MKRAVRAMPATATVTVDAPDDAIVKIEYENGVCEWLRADQFAGEIGGERGVAGRLPFRRVSTVGLPPADPWMGAESAACHGDQPHRRASTSETASAIVAHFDGQLQTGLSGFRPTENGDRKEEGGATRSNRVPYLSFSCMVRRPALKAALADSGQTITAADR